MRSTTATKTLVRRFVLPLLALALSSGLAPDAGAHRPIWGEDNSIIEIPNLRTSFASYRDLKAADQVDLYMLEASAGEELYAGISIPAVRTLEDYWVSVALVGPGLPGSGLDSLPLEPPEGSGVLLFPSEPSEDFFEPFTQTQYWGRQRIETHLPETASYFLMIWNPAGEVGKYVLDVGREEVFGAIDILRFPVWWVRVHAFFGHTPYLIAGLVLGIGIIAAATIWARRRART